MDRPALTKEQVERASRREGITHPVLIALGQQESRILELNRGYELVDGSQRQAYIAQKYGFLGDVLEGATQEEAEYFSAGPLDLITIWSKAIELWPDSNYPRYAFAALFCNVYAIQERQTLKGYPRQYLETASVSRLTQEGSLDYVKERLGNVSRALKEIDFYAFGTRENSMMLAFELASKAETDSVAADQLARLIVHQREHQTELLRVLSENIGTGLTMIDSSIDKELYILNRPQPE